jgi:hypothetical protein
MIKVIKNFLSKEKANILEQDFMGHHIPWFWNDTTTNVNDKTKYNTKNTIDLGQFVHSIKSEEMTSSIFEGFKKVVNNINYDNLIRIKANLNSNKTGYKKSSHQPIHNDTHFIGYKSLIYYVNDSDGDTIFFNDNLKEIKRVNPKKGKAVLFDSNILHCGSNPINTLNRVVINFIFKGSGNEKSILYR